MNLNALSGTELAANVSGGIRPLPLWKSIFFFALAALGFRLAIYAAMPALISAGLSQYEAFVVTFTVPSVILFALAFGLFGQEGNLLTWASPRQRFRLHRLSRPDWLWTIGGFLVAFLAGGVMLVPAQQMIAAIPAIVALLPVCLVIAFVSQRCQNNTTAIVIHWLYNGLPLLFVLGIVLGLI